MNTTHFRWLVLYTRPRYDKKVQGQLDEAGIVNYFPLREELHEWSDRKKLVELPLFPSYIFVYVDERQRIATLQMDGSLKFVHFGGKIAEVSQRTIDNLRLAMIRPEAIRIEETTLRLGQRVRVKHGPMEGMKGNLFEFRGHTRVAIHVEVVNQIVSVEVPIGDLVTITPDKEEDIQL